MVPADLYAAGSRRKPIYPVPALYLCKSNKENLMRILGDYESQRERALLEIKQKQEQEGDSLAWMESCCPCLFEGIDVQEEPPRVGECRLLLNPVRPAASGQSTVVQFMRALSKSMEKGQPAARLQRHL